MKYFDTELNTSLLFAAAGVLVGYISFLININIVSIALAIVVFIILHYAAKKVMKIKEEKKWWTTMAIVFFFFWLITWTIFYNTFVL